MELNKIAAAILLAGLIAMVTGKISTVLYAGAGHHGAHEEKRGYQIAGVVEDAAAATGAAKEEQIAAIIPLLHTADAAAGEKFFGKKCTTCHTADKGGAAKTGPNMWNIVNRDKGSADGFKYSKALAAAEGTWDFESLNHFLRKPKKYLPGTIMAFAGVPDDKERANLIAYLRTLADAPAPIPAAEAPAAPVEEPAKSTGE